MPVIYFILKQFKLEGLILNNLIISKISNTLGGVTRFIIYHNYDLYEKFAFL